MLGVFCSVDGQGFCNSSVVIFFFPLQPPPLPPDKVHGCPTREGLISVHFGSVRLRLAPFGSVWLRFGSVSDPFQVRFRVLGGVGVGSGRGASVRQKNITTLAGL